MTYKTQGIILKYTDLGESSRLLTIYTKDFGKIQAQAKAVKKSTSKLAGHLEPLTLSRLVLARGRSFDIIIDAFCINGFRRIHSSLERQAAAFCAAELVESLAGEGQSDERVFDLLIKALEFLNQEEALENKSINIFKLLIVRFGLRLLVLLGFAPEEELNRKKLGILEKRFKYYLGFAPVDDLKSESFLNEISV